MNNNKIIDENARKAVELMKLEYADEFAIADGGKRSAYGNGMLGGYVGGLMTKKLVQMGEEELLRNYGPKNK